MKKPALLCFLASITIWPANQNETRKSPSAEEQLARVAILKFINIDKSKSHKWLVQSLPDAIYKSMQDKFEFIRTNPLKAQQIANKFSTTRSGYAQNHIQQIASLSKSEIVISGYFQLNQKKNSILIHASIFNAASGQIIGSVNKKSPLNQTIFENIDRIAGGIVNDIYRFALQSDEKEVTPPKKKLRLLVLVPSYKTKKEKKKAIRELEKLKTELSAKYQGQFLTIYEFYKKRKIKKSIRKRINKLAKKKKQKKIINWLIGMGVKDAFIILVRKKKVAITPLVSGQTKKKISYKAGAKAGVQKKALAKIVKIASLQKEKPPEKTKTKISLNKPTKKATNAGGRVRLLVGGSKGVNSFSDTISLLYGGQINANLPLLTHWLGPYFSANGLYGQANLSSNNTWFAGGQVGLFARLLRIGSFDILSIMAGGTFAGKVSSGKSFIVPVATAGAIIDLFFATKMTASLQVTGSYLFDKDIPGITIQTYLGLGYRL